MAYRRCLCGRTDCKAWWLIAQPQAKAATPVTNISKLMLGSSRPAPAKHCEVSSQLWRLALSSRMMDSLQCFLRIWATGSTSILSICRVCFGGGAAENEVVQWRAISSSSGFSFLSKQGRCACSVLWYDRTYEFDCFSCQLPRLSWPEVLMATSAPPARESKWQKM